VAKEFPHQNGKWWYQSSDQATVQDGRWYLAEPIWATTEKHGMLSAAYFFIGTEAEIGGIRPSDWRSFDADISGQERVEQVLNWLAEPAATRPHFITLYFEDVDDYTHQHGLGSAESIDAIKRVDSQLGLLLDGIEKLPHGKDVYVLLVSDHGMAGYDRDEPPLVLDQIIDLEGAHAVEGGPFVFIHVDNDDGSRVLKMRDAINAQWSCGKALLPADAPAAWNIGDSPRWPDLIVQADPGCAVISTSAMQQKLTPADHGWAPELAGMRGIFYAQGPRIPTGTRIGVVSVMDIHPLMLSILGLPAPGPTDGNPSLLPSLLLPKADLHSSHREAVR